MKPFALLACLALLSCASDKFPEPGPNGLIPYATMKSHAVQVVARNTLKLACRSRFPARGLVVGGGGFLTSRADFYMMDIDARTLRRIMIDWEPLAPGTMIVHEPKTVVWIDESKKIGTEDLNSLIRIMNGIWKKGVPDKPEDRLLDSTPVLVLLDGKAAFDDSRRAEQLPGKLLMDSIYDLVRRRGLDRAPEIPSDVACDQDAPR